MSTCPHCKNEISLPEQAVGNIMRYGNSVTTVTECCGFGVRLTPKTSFTIRPYEGQETEDDWGREIKKQEA
jgi:hypothetical protein